MAQIAWLVVHEGDMEEARRRTLFDRVVKKLVTGKTTLILR